MDVRFSSMQTQVLFFDVLLDLVRENPGDPLAYVREFADIGDPVDLLARRLCKDAWACFGGMGQFRRSPPKDFCVLLALAQSGLRLVDFREVAMRLVQLAQPVEAQEVDDDDDDGGSVKRR